MLETRCPVETRHIVELACEAPSLLNSQPWSWRIGEHHLELHVDESRRLPEGDRDGRGMLLSCGAALHHARVAAAALGLPADVELGPDAAHPTHLATLHLTPADPDPAAVLDLAGLDQRITDRRRFTSWPVPGERLSALASSATVQGPQALPLLDVVPRLRVEFLVNRSLDRQEWTGTRRDEHVVGSDGLLVLLTERDDQDAWLAAGQALSEIWLAATVDGLSLVPLSSVIEDQETRAELHGEVLGGLAFPQLVVRIGWQQIGRSDLRRTTRRPLDRVLLP